jgi:hypothetical protein
MPLAPDAERLIRRNLTAIRDGKRPWAEIIGRLTDAQLEQINAFRRAGGYAEISAQIVFTGSHLYDSRITQDGYGFAEVLVMIESALSEESRLIPSAKMTVLENRIQRVDAQGSEIHDQAVLECTIKHPRPLLYSVIPKGDKRPYLKEERKGCP